MTDRELLELAAKAAGYDINHRWNEERLLLNPPVIDLCIPGVSTGWNPLTDDSDALRLAVRLGIGVTPYPIFAKPKHSVIAKIYQSKLDLDRGLSTAIEIIELYNNDPCAATRRAIVRAAAEIGIVRK